MRGDTSDIDAQIPKGTKLLVTVGTGQKEIPTYVKPYICRSINKFIGPLPCFMHVQYIHCNIYTSINSLPCIHCY